LQAATELLLCEGVGGVTIEAVAARSGVAKTTIYRQWDDRDELVVEAIGALSGETMCYPLTASLRSDLIDGLSQLVSALKKAPWGRIVPMMLDAAERDDHFAALTKTFINNRRRPLRERLELARRNGEFAPDTDIDLLAGLFVGPLFYRRYITRQPISAGFAERVVDAVLCACRATDV
jgi:AcrR family transcriptional regulator